jgi:hypothetical protein
MDRTLYIVTCIANPLLWKSRIALAEKAIDTWLDFNNVHVVLVECAYGQRNYQLDHLKRQYPDDFTYIQVRAKTLLWVKENLMNIGIARLPEDAHYIATIDADVTWRGANWAEETMNALDIYPIIQPWQFCYDLGPNNQHSRVHNSFAFLHNEGKHVIPRFIDKTWHLTNDPYTYPHPGFAWAWTRPFLDWAGGLFEWGGVGSGDHHMALALIKNAHMSMPRDANQTYKSLLAQWQNRATIYNGLKIGYIKDTIEHMFHGRKEDRGYNNRWGMFLKHDFNPLLDTKRNTYGVLEFAGNKPELEREWEVYMRARNEDVEHK